MRAKLLLAAALASSLSVTSGYTVQAKVQGEGADYFPDKVAEFKCSVVPIDQDMLPFYAACTKAQAHAFSGSTVTIQYEATPSGDLPPDIAERNARLAIQAPAVTILGGTIQSPDRARRTVEDGPRSTLIVLVNFDGMALNWATEASAHRMMNDPNGERDVNGMFNASTYGRVSFPANYVTVVTVNSPDRAPLSHPTDGCDRGAMADIADALIAAQRPDIDLDVQHKVYFIPRQVPDCKWDGSAEMGPKPTRRAWLRTDSASIFAHELGHHLGVSHAASDKDDDGVQHETDEYDDEGTFMGNATNVLTLNAPHRVQLGYLADGVGQGSATHDMDCGPGPSTAEVRLTIARLDLDPTSSTSPQVYRIARYPESTYFLSFKSGYDWDGTSVPADSVRNRLQIHTHDSTNPSNTLFVKGLADGEIFVGRANRGGKPVPLTIRVVAVDANTITITVNTGCANYQGAVMCGATERGDTGLPGTDMIGTALGAKNAYDHFYDLTLVQNTMVTFDACESTFNTVISLYNRLEIDADRRVTEGQVVPLYQSGERDGGAVQLAYNDDGCGTPNSGSTLRRSLPAGDYSIVVEGYGRSDFGAYTVSLGCAFANHQGAVTCGDTVTGNTNMPGTDSVTDDMGSKNAFDHVYDFTLDRPTTVTFNGCGTTFDSFIAVFDRLVTDVDGAIVSTQRPNRHSEGADEGCASAGPSLLASLLLPAGDYSVVMDGYGDSHNGEYTMAMACEYPPTTAAPSTAAPTTRAPTRPPTRAPTRPPTRSPTRAPTRPPTRSPTRPPTRPPTSSAPTSGPTYFVVVVNDDDVGGIIEPPAPDDSCPEGYGDYGLRHNAALGSTVIVTSHEQCKARCDMFADPIYNGGCKGYQSGMMYGMLYCNCYGGTSYSINCAWWAHKDQPGMNSGALGEIHPRTGQLNDGGRCCSRTAAVFGSPDSEGNTISASSSSTDTSKTELTATSLAVSGVVLVTVLAVIVWRNISKLKATKQDIDNNLKATKQDIDNNLRAIVELERMYGYNDAHGQGTQEGLSEEYVQPGQHRTRQQSVI
jgi:hypothetical protein